MIWTAAHDGRNFSDVGLRNIEIFNSVVQRKGREGETCKLWVLHVHIRQIIGAGRVEVVRDAFYREWSRIQVYPLKI